MNAADEGNERRAWHAIADTDAVPEGLSLWKAADREVLIVRQDECIHALDDSCPHAGASLRNGRLEGRRIRCRAHGLRFDVETGRSLVGGLAVGVYPVRIRDKRVEVLLGPT